MRPIYHITHIKNLPAILAQGGLLCDAEAEQRQICQQSIAYDEIKERRKRRQVKTLSGQSVSAGGVVADYVPFYFANRSPMLCAIYRQSVPRFQGIERDIVYLVSSVERVVSKRAKWCFTNGHAAEAVTNFFDDLASLSKLDWEIIDSWKWSDSLSDPDRKRKKQAEFLVASQFSWEWIEALGVMDAGMVEKVQLLIADCDHKPVVKTQPKWYYTSTVNRA